MNWTRIRDKTPNINTDILVIFENDQCELVRWMPGQRWLFHRTIDTKDLANMTEPQEWRTVGHFTFKKGTLLKTPEELSKVL